ncbi:21044_t:CDS:2 [Cetraspora pellucida]|uniref:21044_t:CDS:1 n=1 Tax=Cetraspora pellucida TaxID=1433469 RepID=A0A9N8ZM27_9GLOM|nr:21044_t:CDS:2 [Cetraspora pellucida]
MTLKTLEANNISHCIASVLFPISILIVRYWKHHNLHLKAHRFIQLVGGISASAFGSAAISTVVATQTPHACDSFVWKIAYICWIAIILNCFLICELWWHFEALVCRFLCIKYETVTDKNLMRTSDEDYVKLPEFTWEEINERVQRGAYLVVCDGLVVDIRSFFDSHPEALLIPKDIDYKNYTSVIAKHINHLQGKQKPRRRLTVAKFIDNINVKFYSREPLAQHAHSRLAIQKMMSMVIGRVYEKVNEKGHLTPKSSYQYLENNPPVEIDTISIKFHRYRLTSKKMINANIEYPVMKFTFSKIHQVEKDVYAEKFLPGHYIEVQSRVNGQIVIRSYTPLEGSLSKSFTIYVKIYPRGLFSQHLNEQLIGCEIQARGPFDAYDRGRAYLSPTLTEPLSSRQRLTGMLPTKKSSLLNPDSPDGCWDELYMIAGGTGITPMLQLIKYHLERSMKQKNDINENVNYKRMHLLFGNRKIEDVIDGILLEDLVLSSQGQLTITYCLSEPPPDWDGLQGRIKKQIIQDWMNMTQGIFLQSPNKSQINILHNHSIRRAVKNEHSWSHSPTLKPQPPFMRSHDVSPTLMPQPPFMQSHEISPLLQYKSSSVHTLSRESSAPLTQLDNQKYENHINDMGPYPESEASTKKSRALSIDPDLANSEISDNLMQGKVIVSGPSGMLVTVEQELLEMGFNEEEMIILY